MTRGNTEEVWSFIIKTVIAQTVSAERQKTMATRGRVMLGMNCVGLKELQSHRAVIFSYSSSHLLLTATLSNKEIHMFLSFPAQN